MALVIGAHGQGSCWGLIWVRRIRTAYKVPPFVIWHHRNPNPNQNQT